MKRRGRTLQNQDPLVSARHSFGKRVFGAFANIVQLILSIGNFEVFKGLGGIRPDLLQIVFLSWTLIQFSQILEFPIAKCL
jgi:hypothetical protein